MVAARAIAPPATAKFRAGVPAPLAQLLAERADLAGHPMERAAVIGHAPGDRPTEVQRIAPREGRPSGPDRGQGVCVAVAQVCEAVQVGELDDAPMPRPTQGRGVECLDAVRVDRGVWVVKKATQDPALGT